MADGSELLFELIGQVGRHLQAAAPQWDGFAVVARFGSSPPLVQTWYYVSGDSGAGSIDTPPAAVLTVDRLRATLEVPAEPLRIAILTFVRDSGAGDMQLLSGEADLRRFTDLSSAEMAAYVRPAAIPGSAVREDVSAPTRPLSVWRADPAAADGVAPDGSLPRLSAEDAVRVADYLDAGAVIARTTMRLPDAWSGDQRPVVGLTKRTDGVWRWDDAVSYYVRRYGLSPGAEFIDDLRARDFRVREVSAARVSAVIDELFGPADAVPKYQAIPLDGSQLLPESYYASYRGQLFRCEPNLPDVTLAVDVGQKIPEGFGATKRVRADEVDSFVRVITTCEYKGTPFSIRHIDGSRFDVSIGGGRRIEPSQLPPRPSMDDWTKFPNVEVLGAGDVRANLDVVEAARVTMAVVPYRLTQGRLSPVHDPGGYGLAVPSANQIFYFRSPAASPFLPRGQALQAVSNYAAVHDPGFPVGEMVARRMRDGWILIASGSVSRVYGVADDGVVLAASGSESLAQISSHLSAQLHARLPIVEPAPARDSGADYFD